MSLVAVCAIVAACGESTAPNPAVVTVDSLLSEIGAGQAFGSAGAVIGVFAPIPSATAPSAAQCPFDASTQAFVCPSGTHDGLTMTMFFQLLDASGAPQSAFNRATTAAIRTVTDLSGTQASSTGDHPFSLTIASHNDQTMSGLLSDTRTLNGAGTTNIALDMAGVGSTTMSLEQTTTNLVMPRRGSHYPQSGSIAMDMTSGDGYEMHSTITFNGTAIATMTMTSGGRTQTCTIDMSQPRSFPVCG